MTMGGCHRERLIKEPQANDSVSYEAYKNGKDVTTRGLYLERMQNVLLIWWVIKAGGAGVVLHLPLPN